MVRLGITNEHVNTNVTCLQTPEWDALLQRRVYDSWNCISDSLTPRRTGVEAMMHLLTDTSIFVSLPNDCYCQMSGKAILYLRPLPGNPIAEKSAAQKRPLDSGSGSYEQQAKRVKLSSNNQTSAERFVVTIFRAWRMMTTDLGDRQAADIVFTRRKLFYSRPIYVNEPRRLAVGLPPRREHSHLSYLSLVTWGCSRFFKSNPSFI